MDNLDFHMVSEELLAKAIEKTHLQTPDYWLTCVLIAVTAWKNDDRERAVRAINSAMELDAKKTASFLLIFNLRMQRDVAAVKWFEALKGMALVGADKSMILLLFSMLSRTTREKVADSTRDAIGDDVGELIGQSFSAGDRSRGDVVDGVKGFMVGMTSDRAFEIRSCRSTVRRSNP